jgi:hypothetical protein
MRTNRIRLATVLAILLAGLATALPTAAYAGSTTTTFTLTGGALSISVPAGPVSLGSAATGSSSITGQLGPVTVTDNRGLLVAAWTSVVSASNFTTGSGSAAETVGVANVSYWSGLATGVTGTAVPTPGQAASVNEVPLSSTGLTAFSLTGGVGNNAATWNPTLVVSIPSAAVVGTYTGTVTHTVS